MLWSVHIGQLLHQSKKLTFYSLPVKTSFSNTKAEEGFSVLAQRVTELKLISHLLSLEHSICRWGWVGNTSLVKDVLKPNHKKCLQCMYTACKCLTFDHVNVKCLIPPPLWFCTRADLLRKPLGLMCYFIKVYWQNTALKTI